jgi:hypothetical protein
MKRLLQTGFVTLAALAALSCADSREPLTPDAARFSSDASHTWQAGRGGAWHGYRPPQVTYDAAARPFEICARWNDPALFSRDGGAYADTDVFSFDFFRQADGEAGWEKVGSSNSRDRGEPGCYIVGELARGTHTFRVTGVARHGAGRGSTTHHTEAWQEDVSIGDVEQITFSVTLVPGLAEIEIDGSVQLSATVAQEGGHVIEDAQLVWTSDNHEVADVDSHGLVTATGSAHGNVKITATYSSGGHDYSGNATVTVKRPPPAVQIAEPGAGAEFTHGDPIAFSGSGSDADGLALTGGALVWTSDRDGEFGVGGGFSYAELSVGEHVITLTGADSYGLSATASIGITIVARPGGGGDADMLTLPGFQGAWESDSRSMSGYTHGDRPAYWYDTGGRFDVAAADPPAQPVFIANIVNGLPALQFDANAGSRFVRTVAEGVPAVEGNGLTIYAVARANDSFGDFFAPAQPIISQYHPGSVQTQQYLLERNHGYGAPYLSFSVRTEKGMTTVNSGSHTFPHDRWVLITARFKDGTLEIGINGQVVGSASLAGAIQPPHPSTPLVMGSDGVSSFAGQIAAVYLYSQGHGDETVSAVEAMLMTKYGLAP